MQPMTRRLALMVVTVFLAADAVRADDVYVQTNLVSNTPGVAPVTDPNLQGTWGMSFTTTSPFWLSNQATDEYIVCLNSCARPAHSYRAQLALSP